VIKITLFIVYISRKLKTSHQVDERSVDIILNENPWCRIRVVSCRQTDGQAHMKKLTTPFRYFAKPPLK